MDRESFENNIQKKFENQTAKAPGSVWESLENTLNADLVAIYASQHAMYKWLSVAAVFIAVLMSGVLLFPITDTNQQNTSSLSYNALLSNDHNFSSFYNRHLTGFAVGDLSFEKVVPSSSDIQSTYAASDEVESGDIPVFYLSTRKPLVEIVPVDNQIYPYFLAGNYRATRQKGNNDSKIWAGVEAGAGTFNADFGGSGALSSSLNPSGLASAIGSGNFVNPTTNINQNMEEGMATTFGVDFGLLLNEKWTLESGIAYTSMDNKGSASISVLDIYTIDNNDFINDNGSIDDGSSEIGANAREATIAVENTYDHEVKIKNSVQFASIPIKAGYFVHNKKFSFRLNAGLSANYLVEANLSDPSNQILNSDNLNLYNDWSFDGVGGFEVGYSILNKFDLTIEPNYRYSITPISNSAESPSRFLVQTGFRYTLK